MTMKALLVTTLLLSLQAHADNRKDVINRLIVAQDVVPMFEEELKYTQQESEKEAQKILDQMLSQMKPSEEYKKKFSDAYLNFIKRIVSPWSAQELATTWGQYYSVKFSDQELSQLVSFYESPLGRKEVAASKVARMEYMQHYQKLGEPILKDAVNNYIKEMQDIARACKCSK